MKYIKAYESINKFDKYLLYKANNNKYYILEIIEYNNFSISARKLFIYTVLIDRLNKGTHQYFNIDITNVNNIIYHSNNLKEVKDAIPALKNVDKFNL